MTHGQTVHSSCTVVVVVDVVDVVVVVEVVVAVDYCRCWYWIFVTSTDGGMSWLVQQLVHQHPSSAQQIASPTPSLR